jgi:hypothetical protein
VSETASGRRAAEARAGKGADVVRHSGAKPYIYKIHTDGHYESTRRAHWHGVSTYPPRGDTLALGGLTEGGVGFGSTPPRGRDPRSTFMIWSRIGKNTLARSGFVKKSARTQVVDGRDKWATNLMVLDQFTDKEMTAFDVLDFALMLRIVGHIDGRFVVDEQVWRRVRTKAELV